MTQTDENDDTDNPKASPPDEQVLDLSFKSRKAPTDDNSSPQAAQKNSSNKRKKKPTKTRNDAPASLNESNHSSNNSSGDEIETDLDNPNNDEEEEEEEEEELHNVESDELNCDTTSADNYYEYNDDYDEPNHDQFGNESETAEPYVEFDSFTANKAKKPEPKLTVSHKTVNKIQPPLAPPPPQAVSSSSSSSKKQMRFQCCFCVYKSHSVSLMQNHIYRHIDTTPYSCFYCGHKSTTKSTIMVHIELCHPNMEVKIKESRVKEEDYYLDLNAASSAPATNAQFSLKDGKSNTASAKSGSNKFEIIANKCQGGLEDEAQTPMSLSSPSVLSPLISSNSSMCSSPSISPAPNQSGKSGGQHQGRQPEVESSGEQFSLESQLKANHSFDGEFFFFYF
jgi:hypothetical protein